MEPIAVGGTVAALLAVLQVTVNIIYRLVEKKKIESLAEVPDHGSAMVMLKRVQDKLDELCEWCQHDQREALTKITEALIKITVHLEHTINAIEKLERK